MMLIIGKYDLYHKKTRSHLIFMLNLEERKLYFLKNILDKQSIRDRKH